MASYHSSPLEMNKVFTVDYWKILKSLLKHLLCLHNEMQKPARLGEDSQFPSALSKILNIRVIYSIVCICKDTITHTSCHPLPKVLCSMGMLLA